MGGLFYFMAVKGEITKKSVSADDIMQNTRNGYDVYMYYMGAIKRNTSCPWRKDVKPSFGVFYKNGVYLWKDNAKESAGNAVSFVQNMFSLSYNEALLKIAGDLNIGNINKTNISPVKWQAPNEEEKEYSQINWYKQPFKKKHHKFWNAAGVSEEWCNKYECYAVASASLNGTIIYIPESEIVFAFPCSEGVKLYFPERTGKDRFRTNIPGSYLWNYSNLQECENLIIQKSVKDAIVTTLFMPCVISVQSEHVKLFWNNEIPKKKKKKINKLAKNKYISFGSDSDGKEKSIKISKLLNWHWINPPNPYLKEGVNDFYSLAAIKGMDEVEKLLKSEKLIQ